MSAKLFQIKGRHPLTGDTVILKVNANSQEEAYDYGYSIFDKAIHKVLEIQPGSEQDHFTPTPEVYQARHEPPKPFHNPEYESMPATTIAEESPTFAALADLEGVCYPSDEIGRRTWLGTIVDGQGITRQVQLVITSAPEQFVDECDVWQEDD